MQLSLPLFPPLPPDANSVPCRAALFDLDGTLVRTFIDFPAMRRTVQGLSVRRGTSAATADLDDTLTIVEAIATTLGGEAGVTARREAFTLLEALERQGCAHPEPIAGASALLRCLREERDIPIGVITRNARSISEELLQRMDLPYDVLIAREDTPEFKPHPIPILLACERLGVSPANAVMTGDLWTDIGAGRAAGVRATIGIQWPHDPPQRFSRCAPDFAVASLIEAAEILVGQINLSP